MESRLRIVKECWGDIPINEIDKERLVKLDEYLRKLPIKGEKKGRSEATINHYFTLLKTLFNYAIRQKKFSGENPIIEFKPYTVDEKRREYSPEELERILEAAEHVEKEARKNSQVQKYAKRIVLLLLYTGMRTGELLNLKWDNIKGDKIILKRTETKQKKEKVIPITEGIKRILEDLKDKRRTGDYVIPFASQKRDRKSLWMTDTIRKIRKYSGIQDFIFHNIRHTASTIMVSEALGKGVGLADVMKVLGHSQIETTMKYIHPDFSRMKKAVQILERKAKRKD